MTDTPVDTPAAPLLGPDEPPAFEVVNAAGSGSAVLLCDHASHRVPRRLGTLGLAVDQLADHIGWDPGAAEVARRLSVHLDAPLVLSGYSRLVIDCNRPLRSAQSIAQESAGVPVPGNRGLMPEDRTARVDALFRAYHGAIDRLLDSRVGRPALLLSIHSFAPVLNGEPRPWQVGVSSWRDRRLAELLIGALAQTCECGVGDDQPYPIEEHIDYTIPALSARRGLPSVMIEIRQDGIRAAADADAWAARLAEAYRLIEAEAVRLCESCPGASFALGES
jgi:predicted N-formylglutamate amidohydrolase